MTVPCQHLRTKKYGFYRRKCDGKRIQRFQCLDCKKGLSSQTTRLSYRSHKPWLDKALLKMLCSGVSQRRCAENFDIKQATVARKILRYAVWAEREERNIPLQAMETVIFDDMETFEHTKCKPLSIAIAVEEKSRRILSLKVSKMPAKGHLARIARKKYGPRPDERSVGWQQMFQELKQKTSSIEHFKSDENPHYPKALRKVFPQQTHQTYKGRRGCVVGQGELKRGGFDPLFSLNHSCAMIRDNLKTLSRRTWCTVKKVAGLQALLDIYRWYHNQIRLKNLSALQS